MGSPVTPGPSPLCPSLTSYSVILSTGGLQVPPAVCYTIPLTVGAMVGTDFILNLIIKTSRGNNPPLALTPTKKLVFFT